MLTRDQAPYGKMNKIALPEHLEDAPPENVDFQLNDGIHFYR